MSRTTATQQARALAQSRSQLAMLRLAGLSPADVGRVFNRAQPKPATEVDASITIPDSPAGLEEMINNRETVTKLINSGQFGALVTAYARNVINKDVELKTQVNEQVQQTLTAWLRDNEPEEIQRLNLANRPSIQSILQHNANPDVEARHGLFNNRAMGAAIDREFDSPAEYFRAIWHNADNTAARQSKMAKIRNAFSSTVPSEGGFLIPEVLRSEMLRVSLETSIVRQRARVIPMETLRVPFPAIDSTSNVSSVYGGIVGYWTEEGAALTSSSANFGRIVLDAKKLTAYTEVPNELISDSIGSFDAFLSQIFPEALGFYEDVAFINGSGVGEPLGVLNTLNAAVVSVAKETNQAAASIVWENIVKMFARMLPSSLDRAVWVCSIDTFPELATMALSVGTGGSAIWLNNGAAGPPMTILGRPVIFTEKAPGVLGAAGDISFVDFGFYLVGDRQVMSAMSSPHYKFNNDQTAYRIIERVDGRPWLQSAITPKNNSSTLSPFVQLAAR